MWELNGNPRTIKIVKGLEYSVIVTEDIAGIMTCHNYNNYSDTYSWNVTVLQPGKYTFKMNCHPCVELKYLL